MNDTKSYLLNNKESIADLIFLKIVNANKFSTIVCLVFFFCSYFKAFSFSNTLSCSIFEKRIIGLGESIHGNLFIDSIHYRIVNDIIYNSKKSCTKKSVIFFEVSNIYLDYIKTFGNENKFKKYFSDGRFVTIGINPGSLKSDLKLVEKALKDKDNELIENLKSIFSRIDTDESFYWYRMDNKDYKCILESLDKCNPNDFTNANFPKLIDDIKYDVTYLYYRNKRPNQYRDFMMFDKISRIISIDSFFKYFIISHTGHLLKNSPLKENLGALLNSKYKEEYLVICSYIERINFLNSEEMLNKEFAIEQLKEYQISKDLSYLRVPVFKTFSKKRNVLIGTYNRPIQYKLRGRYCYDYYFPVEVLISK